MITILFIHYYNSLMIFGQKKTRKYLLPGYSNMISQLAVWTGLEPVTSCVTGRHSNQLNYQTI